jgi:hypothetical protein
MYGVQVQGKDILLGQPEVAHPEPALHAAFPSTANIFKVRYVVQVDYEDMLLGSDEMPPEPSVPGHQLGHMYD